MKATLAITSDFPLLPKTYSFDFPIQVPSGLVGAIVSKALDGKTANANLTATYADPDSLKFDIVVTDNIPFVPKDALTVDQPEAIPPFIYEGLKALLPDGLQVAGVLTFSA